MTEKIEPMTAAEYRNEFVWNCNCAGCQKGHRILAALEEREALLGASNGVSAETVDQMLAEATQRNADAALGALVRRIREHAYGLYFKFPGSEVTYSLDAFGLSAALDSLLPKEPEVVTGKSGREYRVRTGDVVESRHICADGTPTFWATVGGVPVIDAPVVAKLLGGKDG